MLKRVQHDGCACVMIAILRSFFRAGESEKSHPQPLHEGVEGSQKKAAA
ncbi:hypothetical protein FHS49_001851 [Sphingobium boeckii]|uniref:Uncharacterized protein n=1 Tax=Sphingobium boeckii TaxID=1082345 RepID=A0A7W9EF98_9SPHN|nr:hypothetical protein [Sphingobium boeckii]